MTRVSSAAALCAALLPSIVAAQTPAPRDGDSAPAGPLTLRLDVMQAYDDNAAADLAVGPEATRLGLFGGPYSSADASLTFAHHGTTWNVGAHGASDLQYFPDIADMTMATHQADVTLDRTVGRASRFSVSQGARYAPLDALTLVGGGAALPAAAAPAPDLALAVSSVERLESATHATFETAIAHRAKATVTSGFEWQQVDVPGGIRRYDAGAHLSRDVKRHVTLDWGYDAQISQMATSDLARVQNAAMTVRYDRPVSATNHVSFEISGGAASLEQGVTRQYSVVGSAKAAREFGRSWTFVAGYGRELVYFDWLATPVLANRASIDLRGRIGRRLHARVGTAYAGNLEAPTDPAGFSAYSGSVNLSYALTPTLGLYGEYTRFQYDFSAALTVPALGEPTASRNVVRVGVAMQLPILHERERR